MEGDSNLEYVRLKPRKLTLSREKFYLLALFLGGVFYLCLSLPSYAATYVSPESLSRNEIKLAIVQKSKLFDNIESDFALGLARILSNFHPSAIGAKKKIGIFQLNSDNFTGKYTIAELLDPNTNISLGLSKISNLIEKTRGNKIQALNKYNAGTIVGPWPNSKVLETRNGFAVNVLAAQAVFKNNHQSPVFDYSSILVGSNEEFFERKIELKPVLRSSSPEWENQIKLTNFWLNVIDNSRLDTLFKDDIGPLFLTF